LGQTMSMGESASGAGLDHATSRPLTDGKPSPDRWPRSQGWRQEDRQFPYGKGSSRLTSCPEPITDPYCH